MPSRFAFVSVVGFMNTLYVSIALPLQPSGQTYLHGKADACPGQSSLRYRLESRADLVFQREKALQGAPTVCFILLSRSVFSRPACTSRSICDHLLSLSVCSI